MPHFRIEPMKELESLSQRMKKFVEDFPDNFSFEVGRGFEPRADVYHDDRTVRVYVELPGVPRQSIKASLKNNVLYVDGTKSEPAVEGNTIKTLSERAFDEFQKRIVLPAEVNAESLRASLQDGVLEVTVQKLKPIEEKSISIEIS